MKNSDGIENKQPSFPQPSSSLTDQVVAWLKSQQSTIVNELAQEMGDSPAIPTQWLPSFLRKVIAKDMLDDLVTRLKDNIFNQEAATNKMLTALKRGAGGASVEAGIDLLLKVITHLAQQELMEQPILRKAVIDKSQYFVHLTKSCLSTAIIEHERMQASKGKRKPPF